MVPPSPLSTLLPPQPLPAAQASALLTIDHHYYLATHLADDSAGTTALAALIWGSALYIANVGDSRAVLSRRGKAVQLTRDHKAVEPAERRRIEAAGGFVCTEGRLCGELAVSRALGNHHRNLKGERATPAGPGSGSQQLRQDNAWHAKHKHCISVVAVPMSTHSLSDASV
jgi:protein phosphatase 2C family protein 2/3